ncbi:MAG TPA: RNA methyltransferase [Thermomicrobiaceae bacterium]|nr:RNA methyltransferase [Thermomicrobiaceae bacterium]
MDERLVEPILLEGFISVEAALDAGSRPLRTILLRNGLAGPRVARLLSLARQRRVPVQLVDAEEIERLTTGKSHGGILAIAGHRRYLAPEAVLSSAGGQARLLVMLDGLEDPFNLGQAIRALYAGGVDGLLLRERDWSRVDGVIARASAGASERFATALIESSRQALDLGRRAGLRVVCAVSAATPDAISHYRADLTGELLLIIGGELRGISREVVREADARVVISYGRPFRQSLGLVAATSALVFEAARQRRTLP